MYVQAAKPVARDAVLTEAFVWALASLCRLHRVPFDAELVLKQFPPPYDLPTLLRAAQACGLKAGLAGTQGDALERLPLPCLGFVRTVDSANDPAPSTPALLVRADRERLLYLLAGEEAPRTMALGQFAERFEDMVLLAAPAIAAPDDADGAQKRAFGFRWFVPELARHRAIWRDVLLASLAIQIVGLATPLFTQVIIDKVVVHQTQSTLIAIAAGLGIFLVFNAAMTWMRQYLVLHTGNRVDAVLATQVFAHLFRLPLPYSSIARPAPRWRACRAWRRSASSSPAPRSRFVLDLPFLVIILAVMFIYSWQLSLIALGIVFLLTITSVLVTPLLREKLNKQFLLGARNQAFVTEYVSGVETVKSLQIEPLLERAMATTCSTYLAAGFGTRNLANTLQRGRQRARAADDACDPGCRRAAGDAQRRLHHRHAGRLPDVRRPHGPAHASHRRALAGVPAGQHRGEAPGRHHGRAGRAALPSRRRAPRAALARSRSRRSRSATPSAIRISSAMSPSRSSPASSC